MFVTPAFAQTAGGSGSEIVMSILPFILIFVVMYFLIIRPQRQQLKKREEMLKQIRRGDQVVTGGGIIEKVIDGETKSHRFIRADRFPGQAEAADFTLTKGQQIVDMEGERIFR